MTPAPTPIKSPSDEKSYRLVELDNGLRALLVSEPDGERAAAAMAVAVGSRDDPDEYPGLAHFLEHMLFLGTDRYPAADDYQQFIIAHGGLYNAYTAFDHTNYFFELDAAALTPALARFARFFVAPLMSERYVRREREAIEAEYRAGLKDDSRRRTEVFKEQLDPRHPFAGFAVGGLHSLPEAGLNRALREFYSLHYTAGRMRLVIRAPLSLRRLERLLRRNFAQIPASSPIVRREIAQPLFAPGTLPRRVDMVPSRQLHELNMIFPVGDLRRLYRSKPLRYVAHLLGHEGQGSLLSMLKARGWAERLVAGAGLDYDGGGALEVEIGLTPAGFDAVDEVQAAVFAMLDRIRAAGVAPWRFEELRRMAELDFQFLAKRDPAAEVMSLAASSLRYPPLDVLRGSHLLEDCDPQAIEELLGRLRPDNVLTIVTAPEFAASADRLSRHYDVPYAVRARAAVAPRRFKRLRLPEPNVFIPSADWVARAAARAPSAGVFDARARPRLASRSAGFELWHHRDRRFNMPRVDTLAALTFAGLDTAEGAARTALWAALVTESLNEMAYPAHLAGLSFAIVAAGDGLELQLGGYSHSQRQLLEAIAAALRRERWSSALFSRLKAELIRNWRNRDHDSSYARLWARLGQLLHPEAHAEAALIAALEATDADALAAFTRRARAGWHLRALVHGLISAAEAETLIEPLRALAVSRPRPPLPRLLRLAEGERSQWRESFPHPDAAAISYWQGEDRSLSSAAHFALTAQLLKSDFFHQLRTRRQLGYIVYLTRFTPLDTPGVVAVAQSPHASAEDLAQAMREFWSVAADVGEEDFARGRKALLRRLLERPKSRAETSARWWRALRRDDTSFSRRRRLAQAIDAVERDAWLRFVDRSLAGAGSRELLLLAPADGVGVAAPTDIVDMASFAAGRAAFVGPATADSEPL